MRQDCVGQQWSGFLGGLDQLVAEETMWGILEHSSSLISTPPKWFDVRLILLAWLAFLFSASATYDSE